MSRHNLYYDQPGLEVVPEPEAPQVVYGPTYIEKPYDSAVPYPQPQVYQFQQASIDQNAATYPSSAYPPSSAPPPSGMILGVRKKRFWLMLGPLIALLIIGLAVGVGVGLGTAHHDPDSGSAANANSVPTPVECPQANGTVYKRGSENSFLVLCNVDYNGKDSTGTVDIANRETSTVEGCIDACADYPGCAGAGWGNFEGHYVCWMKGHLGGQQNAPGWFFAIRQDQ
ncbi:hypothetical protein GGS23DRAFT_315330 [Durotheca rogersii]|uniref:uncharacterized protein n=1 Tax=Durotheca rogersii TaxID=419775 RepID=UPI0022209D94|nr:uncharacterized protein GGS23DRAFT_315330 [Durotheca rogersii]KAI5859615.1 hypothetical protein GGS23DRAFT_315330 [Durotheca rogersii]